MNKGRLKTIVQLTGFLKGMRWYMALSCLIGLIFRLIPVGIGFCTSYMVGASLAGSSENLWFFFYWTVELVIAYSAFSYADMWVSHDIAYRILHTLRYQIYLHLEQAIPVFENDITTGEIASIATQDTEYLEWFYAHTVNIAFISFACIFIILSGIFAIHPVLGLIVLIAVVFSYLIPFLFKKQSQKDGEDMRRAEGDLQGMLTDGVQGLREIISYQWQSRFTASFEQKDHIYKLACLRDAKRKGTETGLFGIFSSLTVLILLFVSYRLILSDALSIQWLPVTLILAAGVFSPLSQFMAMAQNFSTIFASADRVFGILTFPVRISDEGQLDLPEKIDTLSFEDVSFTYPNATRPALDHVSFTIHTGEPCALSGASGAGKSTVIHLIQRYADPDSGCIKLNGIDLRRYKLLSLRERLAVVTQNTYLFNGSIRENIRMGNPSASDEEILRAAEVAQAGDFIEKMETGYETNVGERAAKISGGQKQRIAIARAILKNADILIFDEASSGLDSENEEHLNRALEPFKQNHLMITVAHRLSTIENARRIIFLKDGKVAEIGSFKTLSRSNPLFRRQVMGCEEEYNA